MQNKTYQNPIIKGFHPDPSICIVGEDAYLINSTFEYFPGVPIYHSKNLVDWELIGHCLTNEEQLPLESCFRSSGGIYAPTLRYHNGRFYMITTNVTDQGNFIVYADDIRGPWSAPQWIDHKGIDPSLLFDGDKVYYCGTGMDEEGKQGIAFFEINPNTGEILSDKHIISYGFGGKHPEGPHLYHLGDYYYLLLAEGGTEYGHMATMLRSTSILGPYESCPHNPILSNRDNMYTRVQCTGHPDIAVDANGNWWMCCLAIRQLNTGLFHNLGRETFLVPLTWQDGWPVLGTDGCVYETMEGPLPGQDPSDKQIIDFIDQFDADELNNRWTFIRKKEETNYHLQDGSLTLRGTENQLHDLFPTFAGIRQGEFDMVAQTTLTLDSIQGTGHAGISAVQCKEHYFALGVSKQEDGQWVATLRQRIMDTDCVPHIVVLNPGTSIDLKMITDQSNYTFWVADLDGWKEVGSAKTAALATEVTTPMTFTGVFIGLYATETDATFTQFSLTEAIQD